MGLSVCLKTEFHFWTKHLKLVFIHLLYCHYWPRGVGVKANLDNVTKYDDFFKGFLK